jgi:hypothetical protein
MSARKIAVAKVATKPIAKLAPAPTQRSNAKRKAAKPSQNAASGTIENVSQVAEQLAAELDRALAEGRTDALTIDAIQALMAAACRSYSAQVEAGGAFSPLAARNRVTSTDVMITASGLLKAANLAVFELGMWQSWTGR